MIISLHIINRPVFIIEAECVYLAVRTGSSNNIQVHLRQDGLKDSQSPRRDLRFSVFNRLIYLKPVSYFVLQKMERSSKSQVPEPSVA